ncbi:DeoR/GlpR family DNA-binding transcription regulator [Saccharopolyspora sp. NPDC002686]|uniref:DeoR/GlpR family DNA-binding transcription regulator n=1 Tax=Saccharopolyspora sp. NPDC002686 TaxID=3154541 RepID=UPI0033297DF4
MGGKQNGKRTDEAVGNRYRYAAQRQQEILRILRTTGEITVTGVSAQLDVTGETIRKDLIVLEQQGLLRRVHGGALPVEHASFEPPVASRLEYSEEKRNIARAALAHLPHTGSVLLDAGSTTTELAELLPPERELTIFTNTLPIALTLVTRPKFAVYPLGGRLRETTLAVVEGWAARQLEEINVDVAFLGTNGISLTRGLTTPDPAEAAIKRLMLHAAHKRVLLADSSKFDVATQCQHATLADIDVLITDSGLSDTDRAEIEKHGVTVEIA